MLSNPEFGFGTSAMEAARVFGEEIRGKCGELFGRFFLFTSGGLGASRDLECLRSAMFGP